jgi:signal transduction histidine kinase
MNPNIFLFAIAFLGLAICAPAFIYAPLPWALLCLACAAGIGAMAFFMARRIRQAARQAQMSGAQLSSVLKDLPAGVIAYDGNFNVLAFNTAAQEIFGVTEAEVRERPLDASLASNPRLRTLIQVVFSTLAPVVIKRSDPGSYPQIADISFEDPQLELRVITDRLMGPDGSYVGFMKLVTDQTREISLLKAKTEFITVAAHQLRTPLTAINWALEALRGETLGDSAKELVSTAFAAVKNALNTVNNLLDASKIEEGKFGYEFQDMDLLAFMDQILSNVNDLAKQYGIKLFYDRPKGGPMQVRIDAQKMSMVLYNLLDNALKYNTEHGQVIVRIAPLQGKPYVAVSIEDTGIGIAPDQLQKLFSKFFRAENAVRTVSDGTGLGLYIARNIVRRHGGEIRVESELNRGTTFHVELPLDPRLVPQSDMSPVA